MSWLREKVGAYLKQRAEQPLPGASTDIHSGRPPALPPPDEQSDRILTLEEKVAILAALHDVACFGVEKIAPEPSRPKNGAVSLPAIRYAALMTNAKGLTSDDRPQCKAILKEVREVLESEQGAGVATGSSGKSLPKPKRSTERAEGRAKLIAALTKHHQYADGGCLNLEPIGNNELAKAAGVSASTASAFFSDKFQGHTKYKALCRDASTLVAALKLLNNEFAPYLLLGDASSDLAAPKKEDTDAE
jgi:hypothetical protein